MSIYIITSISSEHDLYQDVHRTSLVDLPGEVVGPWVVEITVAGTVVAPIGLNSI